MVLDRSNPKLTMFNNQLLDWIFDNGVSIFMTQSKHRNQFMEHVLSKSVKDKNCIDIGFGTGILSFLAVKHGATHVTAFEVNHERYLLGQHLIEKMGLSNKITLYNKRFDSSCVGDHHDLVFQEIFDQEFWADGLVFCAQGHDLPVLPARYRCDYYLCELTQEQAEKFFTADHKSMPVEHSFNSVAVSQAQKTQAYLDALNHWIVQNSGHLEHRLHKFDTGISFPQQDVYLTTIKDSIKDFWNLHKHKKIHQVSNFNHRIITPGLYEQLVVSGKKIASYEFDYGNNQILTKDARGTRVTDLDRSCLHLDLVLLAQDFKEKITILLPVNTVAHNDHELVLTPLSGKHDQCPTNIQRIYCASGWDLPMSHTIFVNPVDNNQKNLYARLYLDSGTTRFFYDPSFDT